MNDELLYEVAVNLAHQVRNPLGIVHSLSQSLALRRHLSAEDKKSYEAIFKNIEALDKRLEEIVDFCRPLVFHPAPAVWESFLENTLLAVDEQCRLFGIAIEKQDSNAETSLWFDPVLMRTALLHIFLNAIEAMPAGGRLEIVWRGDKDFELSIRDTGLGIRPEVLKLVTQPFFTTKANAVGLGLALCRRIARAHGGDMQIAGIAGEGATVTLRWPLNPCQKY